MNRGDKRSHWWENKGHQRAIVQQNDRASVRRIRKGGILVVFAFIILTITGIFRFSYISLWSWENSSFADRTRPETHVRANHQTKGPVISSRTDFYMKTDEFELMGPYQGVLEGCPEEGCLGYSTLEEAASSCFKSQTCGGVTDKNSDDYENRYETRNGSLPSQSLDGQVSFKLHKFV